MVKHLALTGIRVASPTDDRAVSVDLSVVEPFGVLDAAQT